MTDIDFDKLEKLLQNKGFSELTTDEKQWTLAFMKEDEYISMRYFYKSMEKNPSQEIEPSSEVKIRLDKSMQSKKKENLFSKRIPLYQMAAASMLFFLLGLGINFPREKLSKEVHTISQVVKYVDRPVTQIQYVKVKEKTVIKRSKNDKNKIIQHNDTENNIIENQINIPFQQMKQIALNNMNQAMEESKGFSMEGDTVLKKMMVTVY